MSGNRLPHSHEQRFRYNTRSSNKPPQQLNMPLCSLGASAKVPSIMHASTPPFLRFLSHLDGPTWAYVLLSKLIDQGSAGAVALTCSQLRKLCQEEIQHVDLVSICGSRETASSVVKLPERFPNVTSLQLRVDSTTAPKSYEHVSTIITPVLARLPKLHAVDLAVGGSLMRRPMANLLCSFRTQLTQLKCLHLRLTQDWAGAVTCWRELGKGTHLIQLRIDFNKLVAGACTPRDLLHLSTLRGLQDFVLSLPPTLEPSPAAAAGSPQPWLSFANGLTSLTNLQTRLPSNVSIAGIAGCTGLSELVLGRMAQAPLALKEDDWDAIGNLTQLIYLNVCAEVGGSKCVQVFAGLGRLQHVVADCWEPDIVLAFSQLQGLVCIEGAWGEVTHDGSPHLEGITCPTVVELTGVAGHPPFAVFPNLRVMSHGSCICIPALLDLTQHCRGLRELWADAVNSWLHLFSSLSREEPSRDRVGAILALTQLQQLQVLGWKPADDAEVAAFASVAGQLAAQDLRRVGLGLEFNSTVTPMSLMALGRLTQVTQLDLVFCKGYRVEDRQMRVLLSGLSDVPLTMMHVVSESDQARIMAALAIVESKGLPLPNLEVVVSSRPEMRFPDNESAQ